MRALKNLGISFIYSVIFILGLTLLLTFFNYINFIKDGMFSFFMIFNLVVSIFVGGFIIGKRSTKKGWFEGLKFGIIFLVFLILINILGFNSKLSMKYLLFNIIIIISSIFGGMMGIGFRKEKK
ncbi:MAG: TIGR04086 family membrane protein [Bacilli bacterium]|nr:TIGR04086 family membrane protein [Bacilli bacterium]